MSTNNIVLQTSKILTLELNTSKATSYLPPCDLKWRRKNLWVKSISDCDKYSFSALSRKKWLEDCLRNSWVTKVCVDPAIGEQGIKLWAETCDRAGKPIFIRNRSYSELPNCRQTVYWRIKRVLDWLAAFILLMALSPVMLLIALSIKLFTPGSIFFTQWRVGKRGRLFKIYKFRTMIMNAQQQHYEVMGNQTGLHKREDDPRITFLGKWLRKYSLDELPQLFNVLRGEMSLVGPRPWALYDALRLDKKSRKRLNALPGVTGAWQIRTRSKLLDLDTVTQYDMEYLSGWSLLEDFKILLLTVPKVIVGFGAY